VLWSFASSATNASTKAGFGAASRRALTTWSYAFRNVKFLFSIKMAVHTHTDLLFPSKQ